SLLESLRNFLSPALWKQAQAARPRRASSRWTTQPLVLTLLVLTWSCGDSQEERFETARAFVAVSLPKRRRPGKTVRGFDKALALGQGDRQRARPLVATAAGAADGGSGGRRRRLRWLRGGADPGRALGRLPDPDVFPGHPVYRAGGAARPLPRGGSLLRARRQ